MKNQGFKLHKRALFHVMLQTERAENVIEKYLQIKISNGGFNKVQEIELPSKIGRCPKHDDFTSQLALESPYVSREHVMIEPENILFRNKRVIQSFMTIFDLYCRF